MSKNGRRIGDLAKAAKTSVETIRYYERIGLIPLPSRTSNNYRIYDARHVQQLVFIRKARGLGFSLGQVRELLSLADQRRRSCTAVDAIARAHLLKVDRKAADLKSLRGKLDLLIRDCARGSIESCRILEAFNS